MPNLNGTIQSRAEPSGHVRIITREVVSPAAVTAAADIDVEVAAGAAVTVGSASGSVAASAVSTAAADVGAQLTCPPRQCNRACLLRSMFCSLLAASLLGGSIVFVWYLTTDDGN